MVGGAEFGRVLKSKSSKKAGKKAGKKSKEVDYCFEQEMANYEAAIYALYEDTDQDMMSEGMHMYEMMLDYMGNATTEVMDAMSSSMTHNGVYYGPDDPRWEDMKDIMQAYVAGPDALMSHLKAEVASGRRLGCAWWTAIGCVALIAFATSTCAAVTVATLGVAGPPCLLAVIGAGSSCIPCLF